MPIRRIGAARQDPGTIRIALILTLGMLAVATPAAAAPSDAHTASQGPAPGAQPLELVLPLVARDAGLARLAKAVTTPGSPQYAHYQSIPQLARRFGASARVRRGVVAYLRRAGATGVTIDATGLFADATMTARRAQRVFGTRLERYRSATHARFIAPSGSVHVPPGLRGLAQSVVGLDTEPLASDRRFAAKREVAVQAAGQPTSAFPRTGTPSGCPAGVSAGEQAGDPRTAGFTPNQYLSAYGIDQLHAAGVRGQGERVALIEIDGFKRSDIDTFAACFGLDIPKLNGFSVGVRGPLAPGGEATLDVEALASAAPGLNAIDVYETSANAADTLKALTAPLQNHGRRPQVISASLGLCEPAVFGAVGLHGIVSTEAALQMAAISGITLLASSGDSGSADCIGPGGIPLDRLAVNYPASSGWVTAVGGTNFLLNPFNQITSQVVWNDTNVQPGAAAGGGSSEVFRRPFYQAGTVSGRFRAVPDISMLADIIPGYAVFCSASGDCVNSQNPNPWQAVGGTSAATPLLAGGLVLVDQELRMQQRQDLSLVGPLLYKLGRSSAFSRRVFFDVLSYGNDVGPYITPDHRPLGCCTAGPGYDRASGWGSVNLANLAPLAIALQPARIALSLPGHQRPLRRRRVLARVRCTGACRIAAYAVVRIAGKKAFAAESRVFRLRAKGAKVIAIHFSAKSTRRLHAALARHRRISATVFGVVISGRRRIEFQTSGHRLRLGP